MSDSQQKLVALFLGAFASTLMPDANAQGRLEFFGPIASQGEAARAISADGSVVVGHAEGWVTPGRHAYRWSASTGAQPLGSLFTTPGNDSRAVDVSADGLVVVGASGPQTGALSHAFRWAAGTGMIEIASSSAGHTTANGVNADGSVIVGIAGLRAFRWTQANGPQDLGTLGGTSSTAYSVSDDGEVVVGSTQDAAGIVRAFRWTATTGMTGLGGPASSEPSSAFAVSGDGSVIVGLFDNTAFRWTAATGMQPLIPPGVSLLSVPGGVNADGSVILVNNLIGGGDVESYRWSAATGFGLLDTFLPQGCYPVAMDVSADGSVLAGHNDCGATIHGWLHHSSTIGDRYCTPVANSTGRSALLNVHGWTAIQANNVSLAAEFLPPNAFGFFVASRSQGNAPQPGGSQGVLCLGGAIARFIGPGQVLDSGATGSFSLDIDLTAIPAPTGITAVQPGETWNFQAWHRDSNPGATSNFTDAVGVTFH